MDDGKRSGKIFSNGFCAKDDCIIFCYPLRIIRNCIIYNFFGFPRRYYPNTFRGQKGKRRFLPPSSREMSQSVDDAVCVT